MTDAGKMKVDLGDRSYDIHIGRGILADVGNIVRSVSNAKKGTKVAVVTDGNVRVFYGTKVTEALLSCDFDVTVIEVPAGESSKSIEQLEFIYEQLISNGFGRNDLLVALGGGVVGDLAGFAAATYMRGIRYFQVPTSLLAQIDSSVGGKVAINLPAAKNIVGNFYQPMAVIADTDCINTLKPEFVKDGLAEVVKYAVLVGGDLFELVRGFNNFTDIFNHLTEVVFRCCDIKRGIVERDEKESGDRMLLNLGHTLGHSIERYYSYKKYTHGEGVAIGMYEIARYGEAEGISVTGMAEVIGTILDRLGLARMVEGVDRNQLFESVNSDKKGSLSRIKLIIPQAIGQCIIVDRDKKDFVESMVKLG